MKIQEYRDKLRRDDEFLKAEKELKLVLDLADEILRLRLEKGWTQSELARRAGTKQSNISNIESGLSNPTLKFVQKLARALDTEVTISLMGEHEETQIEIQAPEERSDAILMRLAPPPRGYDVYYNYSFRSLAEPYTQERVLQ